MHTLASLNPRARLRRRAIARESRRVVRALHAAGWTPATLRDCPLLAASFAAPLAAAQGGTT